MKQETYARMLRIQCIDKVCDIDLPGFLIDTIESSLTMVNSYKLTNLIENIDTVHEALTKLGEQYTQEVTFLQQESEPANRHRNILQFLTDALLQKEKSTKLVLSKSEALRLKNVYSISCLMMLKEFMHRNTTTQATMHRQRRIRIDAPSFESVE